MSSPAMITKADVDELALVDLIYDSSLVSSRWDEVARELSAICGDAAVGIALHIGDPRRARFASHGFAPMDESYTELQRELSFPFGGPDSEIHDHRFEFLGDLMPREQVAASRYYELMMKTQQLAPEPPLVHILETQAGRPMSAVGICRTLEGPPLDVGVLAQCNALVPHLARAYRVTCELHDVRERRLALSEAIDRFPTGVIVVDSHQRLVTSNQCADQSLELADGLKLVDERPTAPFADDDRRLRETIAAAIEEAGGNDDPEPHIVTLSRPSGAAPMQVMVAALRDVPEGTSDTHPVAVIFVPDPGSAHVETAVLEKLYGLTGSEAAFIGAFVTERNLEDAAAARGIRTSTARGYLKSAFQKTGTHTQHGLMHLLLTGVSRIRKP